LLVGIVVDNASLLFEYIELLIAEGLDLRSAVIDASKIILRPLAMNNGTNMLGLLPVAFELGQGTEFQSPMAITVISGLFASAAVSLYLMPALFYMILERQHKH
jgi:multidrug efflux pump subunit AcrB